MTNAWVCVCLIAHVLACGCPLCQRDAMFTYFLLTGKQKTSHFSAYVTPLDGVTVIGQSEEMCKGWGGATGGGSESSGRVWWRTDGRGVVVWRSPSATGVMLRGGGVTWGLDSLLEQMLQGCCGNLEHKPFRLQCPTVQWSIYQYFICIISVCVCVCVLGSPSQCMEFHL